MCKCKIFLIAVCMIFIHGKPSFNNDLSVSLIMQKVTNPTMWIFFGEKVKNKYLIQIIPNPSPFPIPMSAWREFNSFSCSKYT